MVCNVCGINKATVHVTEFVEGQVLEVHMCDKCASEKEQIMPFPFTLNDVLSGLMKFTSPQPGAPGATSPRQKCPGCHLTIEDIKKTGKVGCGACYTTFAQFLTPLIHKVQGAAQHSGKLCSGADDTTLVLRQQLKELEGQLKKQVQKEHYEDAAATRDKIRKLEEELKKSHKAPVKRAPRKKKTE